MIVKRPAALLALTILAGCLISTASAKADTLFRNMLNPANGNCYFQCAILFGGPKPVFAADNFTLTQSSVLTGFTIDVVGNVADGATIDWRIYSFGPDFDKTEQVSGTPLGTLLFQGQTSAADNGVNVGSGFVQFGSSLPNINLSAGDYWLALHATVPNYDWLNNYSPLYWGWGFGDGNWAWEDFDPNGAPSGWTVPIVTSRGGWAFSVLGAVTVPEPASIALLCAGIGGLRLLQRRAAKATPSSRG
jgi:hypothetical protein